MLTTLRFKDLCVEAVIDLKSDAWAEWKAYRFVVRGDDLAWLDSNHALVDRQAADVFVSGDVKFDGCAHLRMPAGFIHVCDQQDVDRIAEVYRRMYWECADRLSRLDGRSRATGQSYPVEIVSIIQDA